MPAIVCQSFKTVWKRNPISEHEWPEHTLIKRWHISGGMCSESFATEAKAQDYCDFLNKHSVFLQEKTK